MVGEAAGDGVAEVVEARLSHSSQSPPSFHLIQLSSPQLVGPTDSLNRIFSQALHNANVALKPAHGNTSHVITGST